MRLFSSSFAWDRRAAPNTLGSPAPRWCSPRVLAHGAGREAAGGGRLRGAWISHLLQTKRGPRGDGTGPRQRGGRPARRLQRRPGPSGVCVCVCVSLRVPPLPSVRLSVRPGDASEVGGGRAAGSAPDKCAATPSVRPSVRPPTTGARPPAADGSSGREPPLPPAARLPDGTGPVPGRGGLRSAQPAPPPRPAPLPAEPVGGRSLRGSISFAGRRGRGAGTVSLTRPAGGGRPPAETLRRSSAGCGAGVTRQPLRSQENPHSGDGERGWGAWGRDKRLASSK